MGFINKNNGLKHFHVRNSDGKEFRFPELKIEAKEVRLDFTNEGALYGIGDPWNLEPPLSLGFEAQHRLNLAKLKKISEPLIGETKKKSSSQHIYNSQQVLKKALSDEYIRIEKSMHHSLEKISNYFQIQLERVRKIFTRKLNEAGIEKVQLATDPSIHRFGMVS